MLDTCTWSVTSDADTALLRDSASGRSVLIRRPPEDRLPIESLTRLEPLAFAWGNLATQSETEQALRTWLESDPLTVLHGLNWLVALWAVHWDLRSGNDAGDWIRSIDYEGAWRDPEDADKEPVWQALTPRFRLGVLAELTGDPLAQRSYDTEVDELGVPAVLKVTLITIDGLVQGFRGQGMRLEGATAALVEHTSAAGRSGAPPFGRPS